MLKALRHCARSLWRCVSRIWRRTATERVLNLGGGWHCAQLPDSDHCGNVVVYWVLDRDGHVWEAFRLDLRPYPLAYHYSERPN